MTKNNSNESNTFLITILTIIAILLFINIFLYVKKNIYESYDNPQNTYSNINLGINFQSGISSINATDTITFSKPFTNPPMIFTQIIGSTSTSEYVYSVQIFNVTNTGFNYSKNKAYKSVESSQNSTNTAYIIPKIDQSTLEPFIWIAFG
jgi:hypothetical protein